MSLRSHPASARRGLPRHRALLALLLLPACVAFPFLGADGAVDGPVGETTTYEVVDLTGGTITPGLLLATIQPVRFVVSPDGGDTDRGSIGGTTKCNDFTSRFTVPNKGDLRVSDAIITAVPCDPEIEAIEDALIATLAQVRGWTKNGTSLTLRTTDGRRIHLAPVGSRFRLIAVDGATPPATVYSVAGTTTSVTADSVLLRGDGLAIFRTRLLTAGAGGATASVATLTAQYAFAPDSIVFSPATVCQAAPCAAYTARGRFTGTELFVRRFLDGGPVQYRYQLYTPFP